MARGNEGVAGRIKHSWGSIGYVSTVSPSGWGCPWSTLQNKAGRYVEPGPQSGQAALAANVNQIPSNLRLFLPDPDGEDSYPIMTLTWLLLHNHYVEPQKG